MSGRRPSATARRWLGAVALVCALSGLPSVAQALQMQVVTLDDGVDRLLLRDCQPTRETSCRPEEKQFFRGDSARLEEILRRRGFAEVLLVSGGGNLDEGVKVGEVLRRYGAAVRVPAGHRCVSACTVAFLGGVMRTVDAEATYEVHAYSGVREALDDEDRARIVSYPDRALEQRWRDERMTAGAWAERLFAYVQRMIGGRPNEGEIRAALAPLPERTPRYVSLGTYQQDVQRVRLEGAAAAHTAVMNIERSAMEDCIALLRARLPALGRRAEPALKILDTMFSSAIIRTAPLSQETLLQMGYVTPLLPR